MKRRTKMMVLTGVILLAGFMVFMSVGGFAANPQAVTVSATVSASMQLTMASTLALGTQPPGGPYTQSIAATVNSNKTWNMGVVSSGLLTSAPDTIPSAEPDLHIQHRGDANVKNVQGSATQFGTTSTNVCNGSLRGSGEMLNVNYSLTIPWDVQPGTYTATHTYTVTQP